MQNTGTTCTVQSTLRRNVPAADLCTIAQHILGPRYTLSIVLIGDTRARTLNKKHRNKDTSTNVLSFPLTSACGEIFLNIPRIEREAHRFHLSPQGHLRYLLIHGCLHLKGYHHGGTMEQAEQTLLNTFAIR